MKTPIQRVACVRRDIICIISRVHHGCAPHSNASQRILKMHRAQRERISTKHTWPDQIILYVYSIIDRYTLPSTSHFIEAIHAARNDQGGSCRCQNHMLDSPKWKSKALCEPFGGADCARNITPGPSLFWFGGRVCARERVYCERRDYLTGPQTKPINTRGPITHRPISKMKNAFSVQLNVTRWAEHISNRYLDTISI